MFFTSIQLSQATEILEKFRAKKLKLACAESCTGGLLSALFTSIPNSSDVFERGFVTYSNESKTEMLGVKKESLKNFGAVSEEVAKEMAIGALKNSQADIAISITGIAGPKSDDTKKPVGLVYIAIAQLAVTLSLSKGPKIRVRKFNFSGDRDEVRKESVAAALNIFLSI